MHPGRQDIQRPVRGDITDQSRASLVGLIPGWCELSAPGQCRPGMRALAATLTYRRDFKERHHHISDRKPKGLHPMKMRPEATIDAECNEFIQPWHQHAGSVFTEPEHL